MIEPHYNYHNNNNGQSPTTNPNNFINSFHDQNQQPYQHYDDQLGQEQQLQQDQHQQPQRYYYPQQNPALDYIHLPTTSPSSAAYANDPNGAYYNSDNMIPNVTEGKHEDDLSAGAPSTNASTSRLNHSTLPPAMTEIQGPPGRVIFTDHFLDNEPSTRALAMSAGGIQSNPPMITFPSSLALNSSSLAYSRNPQSLSSPPSSKLAAECVDLVDSEDNSNAHQQHQPGQGFWQKMVQPRRKRFWFVVVVVIAIIVVVVLQLTGSMEGQGQKQNEGQRQGQDQDVGSGSSPKPNPSGGNMPTWITAPNAGTRTASPSGPSDGVVAPTGVPQPPAPTQGGNGGGGGGNGGGNGGGGVIVPPVPEPEPSSSTTTTSTTEKPQPTGTKPDVFACLAECNRKIGACLAPCHADPNYQKCKANCNGEGFCLIDCEQNSSCIQKCNDLSFECSSACS
ncbi:hypothetical protein BGZ94_009975 [Podila epigama]|nr:hypothetical protein BGZ94_009975 [Podila epigama]